MDEIFTDPDTQYLDEATGMNDDMHVSEPPIPPKHAVNSTVRRTSTVDRSPSVRRTNAKRRSSGLKQPLRVDLTFGNSPSTVRQFRRVSDKDTTDSGYASQHQPTDENVSPQTLFTDTKSKEAQLGRRAYNTGVGLACQEVLGTTADHEKREAIARLAEAWSDLEMVDPEGLYHILKAMNEKFQRYVSVPCWPGSAG